MLNSHKFANPFHSGFEPRFAKRQSPESLGTWNDSWRLVRIGALPSAGVNRRRHIIIGLSRLDGTIGVSGPGVKRRADLRIGPSRVITAIKVVAGSRSAGTPGEINGVLRRSPGAGQRLKGSGVGSIADIGSIGRCRPAALGREGHRNGCALTGGDCERKRETTQGKFCVAHGSGG